MEQALKDTTPDKMESVLRSVRDYQARLMQECRGGVVVGAVGSGFMRREGGSGGEGWGGLA